MCQHRVQPDKQKSVARQQRKLWTNKSLKFLHLKTKIDFNPKSCIVSS